MEERGLADFLACKVGMALAAFALASAIVTMSSGAQRTSERDELIGAADSIGSAIRMIDGLPGEVKLVRELPTVKQQFRVTIVGARDGGAQKIQIEAFGRDHVELLMMLKNVVNGGNFHLNRWNPTHVRLTKSNEIHLELI